MQQSTPAGPYFVPRILWGAMIMSQFLFLFILVAQSPFDLENLASSFAESSMVFPLAVIAAVNFLVSLFVPKFFISQALKLRAAPGTEADILRFCFPAFIVRLATSEAVTLFGFVLANETKNSAVILPFLCASLFIFLLSFPRPQLFRAWLGR